MAELLLDVLVERLDDLLRPHPVRVDRVRDVAHHRLDLHPVRAREELDELLTVVLLLVAENSRGGRCTGICGHDLRLPWRPCRKQSRSTRRSVVLPSASGTASSRSPTAPRSTS